MFVECDIDLLNIERVILPVAKLSIATGHAIQIYNCPVIVLDNCKM